MANLGVAKEILVEKKQAKDQLQDLEKNGVFKVIEAWILNPLEVQAFEKFGNIKPNDIDSIMEVQIKQKAVQLFRTTWNNVITQGQIAEAELSGDLLGDEEQDY